MSRSLHFTFIYETLFFTLFPPLLCWSNLYNSWKLNNSLKLYDTVPMAPRPSGLQCRETTIRELSSTLQCKQISQLRSYI
ncbi:hypothetical protein FKM82_024913 [Ascaphus truei]